MAVQVTRWQRIRKFFNDIHLWLGLSSGLVLVLICFSGTVYVFNTELTELGAPHLYTVTPGDQPRIAADQFIEKVEKESGGKVTAISIPEDLSRTYRYSVKVPGNNSRGGVGYMVNPYTGEITGTTDDPNGVRDFMRTMFSLHRWLLLDKIETPLIAGYTNRELGSMISGWATIIFTLGCITGLIIWIPKKLKNWKQGLKIKFSANWKRINHDLHNTLAFYSVIFVLIMGLTGPQWSFSWYREGLQKSLGTYQPKKQGEKKSLQSSVPSLENRATLPLMTVLEHANDQLPYQGVYSISLPEDSSGVLGISKYKTGFFAPAAADRLSMDQYTGNILNKEIFSEKPFNERIAGSIKALHIGTVYGMFSKIIYFITCLIATSLPITGTMIWYNKLKKKKNKVKKTMPIRHLQPEQI